MLASTVQFSRYGQQPDQPPRTPNRAPYKESDRRTIQTDPATPHPTNQKGDPPETTREEAKPKPACSLRTQQCAYATTNETGPRSTHHPKMMEY
jgi:hypothetical protein